MLVTLLLFAIAGAQGKLRYVRTLANRDVMARAVLEAAGSYAYLISLMYIPLAIALGINMAVPLVVLPFAVLLLDEQVGWRRWSALAVGFAGVLLDGPARPGRGRLVGSVALASTVVLALRDVTTRRIPVAIPSILVTAFCGAVLTLSAAAIVLYQGWQATDPGQLARPRSRGGDGGRRHASSRRRYAHRRGLGGRRLPLHGAALGRRRRLCGLGDLPGPVAWAGIVLIAGSGLYAAHRERVRHLQAGPKS